VTDYHTCAPNTIEATIGERFPLPVKPNDEKGTPIFDYSFVMCIFMAFTFTYVIIATVLGSEWPTRSMTIRDTPTEVENHQSERM
jgi:hypothetical protein